MNWLPIDTAPKDGTEILGWNGASRAVIDWVGAGLSPRWRLSVAGSYVEDDEFHPTLWMPLPEPPRILTPAPAPLLLACGDARP